MGLEVVPVVLLIGVLFFSPSKPVNANYVGSLRSGVGMNVEVTDTTDQANYRCIYQFVTAKYSKVPPEDAHEIATTLVAFGRQHQVDPKFTAALIARESGFNRRAISSSGAKGLGQIKDMNFPKLNISDPFDIRQNVSGTTQYMKSLLTMWKDRSEKVSLSLASYFRGPVAVSRDQGVLDDQSRAYVSDILGIYEQLLAMK